MLGLRRLTTSSLALTLLFPLGCSSDPTEESGSLEARGDAGSARSDAGSRSDASTNKETGAQCDDGIDNDHNGKTDCEDPSCKPAASCTSGPRDASVPYTDDSGACSVAHGEGVSTKLPVDVVWVIDDSASMLDDITRIQQNMATFAQSLTQVGLDDYHIIVLNEPALTLAPPWDAATLGLDPSRFFPLSVIAWNDCFTPAITSFSQYAADLRADAALHFIMVTDDNSLMSWADFKSQMDSLLGGRSYTVHAIVDPPQHCLGSTRPGTAYWDAAMATGGQQRSICDADWSPTFAAIEDTIQSTAKVPCQYVIPNPGDGQTYDRSQVNVQHVLNGVSTPYKRKSSMTDCGSDTGWYYDDPNSPTQVLLCPAACSEVDQQGGSINIDFVCDGQVYL